MAKNPKFTVLYEQLRGKTFEIDRDSMLIGRKVDCDIQIADGSVSGSHAVISKREENGKTVYVIRDNDSTNGTRINNIPVTEQILKNSDLITFGNVEVLFDDGTEKSEAAVDFSQMTHTIDISNIDTNTSTSQTLVNFNPMAEQDERKQKMIKHSMHVIYLLLGIGLAALIYVVFSK